MDSKKPHKHQGVLPSRLKCIVAMVCILATFSFLMPICASVTDDEGSGSAVHIKLKGALALTLLWVLSLF